MEITLNSVKTLDHLKVIIATKHPWVKMHSDYLSLKYQGVKLTIEPKKNGVYDINKDVPILMGLLLAVVIIVALYGLAALIYPQMLAKQHFIVFIGAAIFVSIAGWYNQKAKPAIENFYQELEEMCNNTSIIEKLKEISSDNSEQMDVQKRVLIRNTIIGLIVAIVCIPIHYSTSIGDGQYVDNGMFLVFSGLCALYSVYLVIKLLLLKRKR
jgi:hypothetical protein